MGHGSGSESKKPPPPPHFRSLKVELHSAIWTVVMMAQDRLEGGQPLTDSDMNNHHERVLLLSGTVWRLASGLRGLVGVRTRFAFRARRQIQTCPSMASHLLATDKDTVLLFRAVPCRGVPQSRARCHGSP